MALQHLDLIAVGVGHEKETRKQRALVIELDNFPRIETCYRQALVFCLEIINAKSHVAIAVAKRVGNVSAPWQTALKSCHPKLST